MKTWSVVGAIGCFAMLVASVAAAQSPTSGAISGVATDATGGVLPGVTVEASSPALIEGVRTAVTSGDGFYRILDLRPGAYAVTFTLPGFNAIRREGVELTTGFTATINAELAVGSVAETVTVTGASPVVDIQNVRTQTELGKEFWHALPTAKNLRSFVSVTLGAQFTNPNAQDVGGSQGERAGPGAYTYHGAGRNDSRWVVDGMPAQQMSTGGGAWTLRHHHNYLGFEEVVIGGGISAEGQNAGVLVNQIPREGGNLFSGVVHLNGARPTWRSDNLNDELVARGVREPQQLRRLFDVGFGIGGPIKRDRLWFFASPRWWEASNTIIGSFHNATPGTFTYTPDLNRPAVQSTPHANLSYRLTWQAAQKHKLAYFSELQSSCSPCGFGASPTVAPEAGLNFTAPFPSSQIHQAKWTYPVNNSVLIEAGNSLWFSTRRQEITQLGDLPSTTIPMRDLETNTYWDANGEVPYPYGRCCPLTQPGAGGRSVTNTVNTAVSVVTGGHAFKAGFQVQFNRGWGSRNGYNETPYGPIRMDIRGGVDGVPPSGMNGQIQVNPNPLGPADLEENTGAGIVSQPMFYVQDQWTIDRLTLNLGLRYDGFRARYEDYISHPWAFFPEEQFLAGVENAPNWSDINPRVGVAYDLFGDGRTAVKASFGRYVQHETSALRAYAPAGRLGISGGTRPWNDVNGDLVPDCDINNFHANGECGRLANLNFGRARAPSADVDPDYQEGWHTRRHLWQASASIQHELRPGMALNVGYFYTTHANLTSTDNTLVGPGDYTGYCVQTPTHSLLGSFGGSLQCGLYDLNPEARGRSFRRTTLSENFGEHTEVFHGIDIGLNARFLDGGVIQGGVSTGRTNMNNCFVVDSPQQMRDGYCDVTKSWAAQTQVKLAFSYPLPWDMQLSGNLQNLTGPAIRAFQTIFRPSQTIGLGRRLSSGFARAQLLPTDTFYEKRFTQLDLRVSKLLEIGGVQFRGEIDFYNLFNSAAVLSTGSTYPSSWQRPSAVLGARLIKLGLRLDF